MHEGFVDVIDSDVVVVVVVTVEIEEERQLSASVVVVGGCDDGDESTIKVTAQLLLQQRFQEVRQQHRFLSQTIHSRLTNNNNNNNNMIHP